MLPDSQLSASLIGEGGLVRSSLEGGPLIPYRGSSWIDARLLWTVGYGAGVIRGYCGNPEPVGADTVYVMPGALVGAYTIVGGA